MYLFASKCRLSWTFRAVNSVVLAAFFALTVLPSPAMAQGIFQLPPPGVMVALSPAFAPATIKGIKLHPDNPMRFDFIIDTGDSNLRDKALQDETSKLIKYFLASLTVPEDDLWVNLSPYEKDRIIPNEFGTTEMGRDLLAQDYLLKQITSSLIYPDSELGKKFWDRVYAKAKEKYGTIDIPVNTFNKVWIMPEKAKIYKHDNAAFVVESHLKVMLEEDYLAISNQQSAISKGDVADSRKLMAESQNQIIRDLIIPELEKEVNEGKNFASLRQVYHSLILATWFKRNLKENILSKVYVGQNKVEGVDIEDKDAKQKIYNTYLEAYKKGVYNFIREEYDPATEEEIPRKYFSGGVQFAKAVSNVLQESDAPETAREVNFKSRAMMATADFMRSDMPAPSDRAMMTSGDDDRRDRRDRERLLRETDSAGGTAVLEPAPAAPTRRTTPGKTTYTQADLPDLYYGQIERMVRPALRKVRDGGEFSRAEFMEAGIEPILKILLTQIAEGKRIDPTTASNWIRQYRQMRDEARNGSAIQNFAVVMAAFVGEQAIRDEKGDFTNIYLPRDMGLGYTVDRTLNEFEQGDRQAGLYYVSRASLKSANYGWISTAISYLAGQSTSQKEFLQDLGLAIMYDPARDNIEQLPVAVREIIKSRPTEGYQEAIAQIVGEIEELGYHKLARVRFVDTGFKTFPLMLQAIFAARYPDIETEGLVVSSSVRTLLPQLEPKKWTPSVYTAVNRRPNLRNMADNALALMEDDGDTLGLHKHPLKFENGAMRPTDPDVQVQAAWNQLAFASGAMIYNDLVAGITRELEAQGLTGFEASAVSRKIIGELIGLKPAASTGDITGIKVADFDLEKIKILQPISLSTLKFDVEKYAKTFKPTFEFKGFSTKISNKLFALSDLHLKLDAKAFQTGKTDLPMVIGQQKSARPDIKAFFNDPNIKDVFGPQQDWTKIKDALGEMPIADVVKFSKIFIKQPAPKITYKILGPDKTPMFQFIKEMDIEDWQPPMVLPEDQKLQIQKIDFMTQAVSLTQVILTNPKLVFEIFRKQTLRKPGFLVKAVLIAQLALAETSPESDDIALRREIEKGKIVAETPAESSKTSDRAMMGEPAEMAAKVEAFLQTLGDTRYDRFTVAELREQLTNAPEDWPLVLADAARKKYVQSRAGSYSFGDTYGTEDRSKVEELYRRLNSSDRNNGIDAGINSTGDWIYRWNAGPQFNPTHTGSLNIRITEDSMKELDALITENVIQAQLKIPQFGRPVTAQDRHDAITIYFVEYPSDAALSRLSEIARKYHRGDNLLGRKITDGFWMSEFEKIEEPHVEALAGMLKDYDQELGGAFESYLNRPRPQTPDVDRYALSVGEYYALRAALQAVGLTVGYDAVSGFRLEPSGDRAMMSGAERAQVQAFEDKVRQSGYRVVGGLSGDLYRFLKDHTGVGLLASTETLYSPDKDRGVGEGFVRHIYRDGPDVVRSLREQGKSKVRILVIGPGTGVDVFAAVHFAKSHGLAVEADAVDINPQAVQVTQFNYDTLIKPMLTEEDQFRVRQVAPGQEFVDLAGRYDWVLFQAPDAVEVLETPDTAVQMPVAEFTRIVKYIRDHILAAGGVFSVANRFSVIHPGKKIIPQGLEVLADGRVWKDWGEGELLDIMRVNFTLRFQKGYEPQPDNRVMIGSLAAGQKTEIARDELQRTDSNIFVTWGTTAFKAGLSPAVDGNLIVSDVVLDGKPLQILHSMEENTGTRMGIIDLPAGRALEVLFSQSMGEYLVSVNGRNYFVVSAGGKNYLENLNRPIPADAFRMRSIRFENGKVVVEAGQNTRSATTVWVESRVPPLSYAVRLGVKSQTKTVKFRYTGPVNIVLADRYNFILEKEQGDFILRSKDDAARRLALTQGSDVVLGRRFTENPFGIGTATPDISGRHLTLRLEDASLGIISIEDAVSTNGTDVAPAAPDRAMMGRYLVDEETMSGYLPREYFQEGSADFRRWYDATKMDLAKKRSVNRGRDIAAYLRSEGLRNFDVDITRAQNILAKIAQDPSARLVIEVGGGDTKIAAALAEKNPDLNVITLDEYDLQGPEAFSVYAKAWSRQELAAQRSPLADRLAVVRAGMEMLTMLPDASIDHLVLVMPTTGIFEKLTVMLREFGLLGKLKPEGSLIIRSSESTEDYLKLTADGLSLGKRRGYEFLGVDLLAESDWQQPVLRGNLYEATKRDRAMTTPEDEIDLTGQHPVGERDFTAREVQELLADARSKQPSLQDAQNIQSWREDIQDLMDEAQNPAAQVILNLPEMRESFQQMIAFLTGRGSGQKVNIKEREYTVNIYFNMSASRFVTGGGRAAGAFTVKQDGTIDIYFSDIAGLVHEVLEQIIFPSRTDTEIRKNQSHTLAFFAEGILGGEKMYNENYNQTVYVPRRVAAQFASWQRFPDVKQRLRRFARATGRVETEISEKKFERNTNFHSIYRDYALSMAQALKELARSEVSDIDLLAREAEQPPDVPDTDGQTVVVEVNGELREVLPDQLPEGAKSFSNVSVASRRGLREDGQQDRFVTAAINLAGVANGIGQLAAVFDGFGGPETAERLKDQVQQIFIESLRSPGTGDVQEALTKTVSRLQELTVGEFASGSTGTIVYIPRGTNTVHAAVVGDSPLIVRDKDGTVHKSAEHNKSNSAEIFAALRRGAVFDEDGRYLVYPAGARVLLTRAFGLGLESDAIGRTPDLYRFELGRGSFVFLASDGITNMQDPERVFDEGVINALVSQGMTAQQIADAALRNGSYDNVTAVLLKPSRDAAMMADSGGLDMGAIIGKVEAMTFTDKDLVGLDGVQLERLLRELDSIIARSSGLSEISDDEESERLKFSVSLFQAAADTVAQRISELRGDRAMLSILDGMVGDLDNQGYQYFRYRVLDELAEFQQSKHPWGQKQHHRMLKLIAADLGLIGEEDLPDEVPLREEIFKEALARLKEFSFSKAEKIVDRHPDYTFVRARLRTFFGISRGDYYAVEDDLRLLSEQLKLTKIQRHISAQREVIGQKVLLSLQFSDRDGQLQYVGTTFGTEISKHQFIVAMDENGMLQKADLDPKEWGMIPPRIQNMIEVYNDQIRRGDLPRPGGDLPRPGGDRAMTGRPSDVGGIDFNPAQLNIETGGENIQMNVPAIDMKMFEGPGFRGLTPFIIQIVPVTNLPLLLGTKATAEEEKISMR